jgi:hypothetical protein
MCRALRVLCAAADPERLGPLRRASVSASWELIGGAVGPEEAIRQAGELAPDVVVLDGLGPEVTAAIRGAAPRARVVTVGPGTAGEADATVRSLDEVRPAILGIPLPGGPVRT